MRLTWHQIKQKETKEKSMWKPMKGRTYETQNTGEKYELQYFCAKSQHQDTAV